MCANHNHGWLHSQTLFHNSPEVWHLVHHLDCCRLLVIALPDSLLFLPHFDQNVTVISQMLKAKDHTATHRVLRGEEEGEQDHRHFPIAKVCAATLIVGIVEELDPCIEHALGLFPVGHCDLAVVRGKLEPMHGNLACLNRPPDFCSRERKGEVDQLETLGDCPILVVYLLGSMLGNVLAAKNAEGGVHVHIASCHHNRHGGVCGGRVCKPIGKVLSGDGILDPSVNSGGGYDVRGEGQD